MKKLTMFLVLALMLININVAKAQTYPYELTINNGDTVSINSPFNHFNIQPFNNGNKIYIFKMNPSDQLIIDNGGWSGAYTVITDSLDGSFTPTQIINMNTAGFYTFGVQVTYDSLMYTIKDVGGFVVGKFIVVTDTLSTTGINDHVANVNNMVAYPNPSNGNITVKFDTQAEKQEVQIYDIMGRLVMSNDEDRERGINKVEIDLTTQAKGLYFVRVDKKVMKITVQ